jgi:predicted dehydrogenase
MSRSSLLVIGCGSIGLRHVQNLLALGHEVVAADVNPERLAAAAAAGASAVSTLVDGLARHPRAALVCTPPRLHVETARRVLDAGLPVFIEKPIAPRLCPELDALLETAEDRGLTVAVGYNLRFHAPLLHMHELLAAGVIGQPLLFDLEFGQYLPDWRAGRDYRQTYTAAALEDGGGILLDASHEIDCLRWLAGGIATVQAMLGRVSDLEMRAEDTAFLTLSTQIGICTSTNCASGSARSRARSLRP